MFVRVVHLFDEYLEHHCCCNEYNGFINQINNVPTKVCVCVCVSNEMYMGLSTFFYLYKKNLFGQK